MRLSLFYIHIVKYLSIKDISSFSRLSLVFLPVSLVVVVHLLKDILHGVAPPGPVVVLRHLCPHRLLVHLVEDQHHLLASLSHLVKKKASESKECLLIKTKDECKDCC